MRNVCTYVYVYIYIYGTGSSKLYQIFQDKQKKSNARIEMRLIINSVPNNFMTDSKDRKMKKFENLKNYPEG